MERPRRSGHPWRGITRGRVFPPSAYGVHRILGLARFDREARRLLLRDRLRLRRNASGGLYFFAVVPQRRTRERPHLDAQIERLGDLIEEGKDESR